MTGTSFCLFWWVRFIPEMFAALSAALYYGRASVCFFARLAGHYFAIYSVLGSYKFSKLQRQRQRVQWLYKRALQFCVHFFYRCLQKFTKQQHETYRLLHGKCARTVFTHEFNFLIQKQRVCKYRTKHFPCCNLFIFYLLRFFNPNRFSPFIRQTKYQVMFSFRPSASTSLHRLPRFTCVWFVSLALLFYVVCFELSDISLLGKTRCRRKRLTAYLPSLPLLLLRNSQSKATSRPIGFLSVSFCSAPRCTF